MHANDTLDRTPLASGAPDFLGRSNSSDDYSTMEVATPGPIYIISKSDRFKSHIVSSAQEPRRPTSTSTPVQLPSGSD
uniref:Uncharacterized protein n=1 Tax=Setaria italica TaxID=4555 RepID=K3ZLP4_SETIT